MSVRLRIFALTMQSRLAASGRFRRVKAPEVQILDVMGRPGSGFLRLADDGRGEMLLGLAGRFWSPAPTASTRTQPAA